MTRRTDSASLFSHKKSTLIKSLMRRLERKGEVLKCDKCGYQFKENDPFYRSFGKVYCQDCWVTLWIDVEDSDDFVWRYNSETDSWILIQKRKEGGSQNESGRSNR